jgi:hypothetical protein
VAPCGGWWSFEISAARRSPRAAQKVKVSACVIFCMPRITTAQHYYSLLDGQFALSAEYQMVLIRTTRVMQEMHIGRWRSLLSAFGDIIKGTRAQHRDAACAIFIILYIYFPV